MKFYNSYIVLLAFAFLISFTACEDYLTKEIEFEEIGYSPKMVVNSRISSEADSLFISVSKNVNYAVIQNTGMELIDDVTMTLDVDGQVFEASKLPSQGVVWDYPYNYFIDLKGISLAKKNYVLKGSHSDYPEISASIYLPIESTFISFELEKDGKEVFEFGESEWYDVLTVKFDDNPDEENYYMFRVSAKDFIDTMLHVNGDGTIDTFIYVIPGGYGFNIASDDIDARVLSGYGPEGGSILYSDASFDGKSHEFELLFSNWSGEFDYDNLYLEYRNISKSDYLFRQSYSRYRNSQDFGFFSEPTTLLSNIEGGLGLFSAEDIHRFDLE